MKNEMSEMSWILMKFSVLPKRDETIHCSSFWNENATILFQEKPEQSPECLQLIQ